MEHSHQLWKVQDERLLLFIIVHLMWLFVLPLLSYEYLRMAFSELRGQLMHLTGTDPLIANHPLGGIPIKVSH